MGNKRRIIKRVNPNQPVPIVDTGLVFNNCKVFLAVGRNSNVIKQFGAWISRLASRSRQMNMGDYYSAHLGIRDKMLKNEALWN